MSETIDYGKLMHEAMRGLIQEVLTHVRDNGLPGTHHFFITFDTTYEGAQLADWLRERYPSEMTVVMQHWYDNLEVNEDGFGVTLNFGDNRESLYIPYDAILTFVDPSVEFGLRFETHEEELEPEDEDDITVFPEPAEGTGDSDEDAPDKPEGDVVSLDSFRK